MKHVADLRGSIYIHPLVSPGIGSRPPPQHSPYHDMDTKIRGYSSPLYKMVQHSHPTVPMSSAATDTEGRLFLQSLETLGKGQILSALSL